MSPEVIRIVTDPPDPNCQWCKGRGVTGGCEGRHPVNPNHMHTISFCQCVNERYAGGELVEENPDLT